jgi:RNA polymerase sigma-70 factor (ECF subfamily)
MATMPPDGYPQRSSTFPTTHWSLVVEAGGPRTPESGAALAALCETYWYPLYAWARRSGYAEEEARDLIQGFFARFLEKDYLKDRSPAKGKFRSYLLAALRHFATDEYDRTQAKKRGGGQCVLPLELDIADGERRYLREPSHNVTPEYIYELRWAFTLMRRALAGLRTQFEETGRSDYYGTLEGFLPGGRYARTYEEAAERLGLTVSKVKGAVHRLRGKYREMLRTEVAHTVSRPEDVEEEIRHLIEVVGGRS